MDTDELIEPIFMSVCTMDYCDITLFFQFGLNESIFSSCIVVCIQIMVKSCTECMRYVYVSISLISLICPGGVKIHINIYHGIDKD